MKEAIENKNTIQRQFVEGFSKMSKMEKIEYISEHYFEASDGLKGDLLNFWHRDFKKQKVFDEFSENTISNYYLPFGVAPNFLINDKIYMVPMVIEESSVVAAASKGAKFWGERGGIKAKVIDSEKIGQVHFSWKLEKEKAFSFFQREKKRLLQSLDPYQEKMVERGGGIRDVKLVHKEEIKNYFQLFFTFETCDAMGANFINTILEKAAESWEEMVKSSIEIPNSDKNLKIIMSILSNYTPNSIVHVEMRCPLKQLKSPKIDLEGEEYAEKFIMATEIARIDPYRAVTHNKGIFNGIDAVTIATGNDFRAVEACGHAYAARSGQYRSLSTSAIENGEFIFSLDVPMSLGTVGGLTSLHPLAKVSLKLLQNPSAKELMMIAGAVGLAQNFGAINSLVTTGIQKGHMKMHLMNILNQLSATDEEIHQSVNYFKTHTVSFAAVRDFITSNRKIH